MVGAWVRYLVVFQLPLRKIQRLDVGDGNLTGVAVSPQGLAAFGYRNGYLELYDSRDAGDKPSWFITHGFSSTEAGLIIGMLTGVAGGLGTYSGGWLGDRFAGRDPRWRLWWHDREAGGPQVRHDVGEVRPLHHLLQQLQ